MSEYAVSVVRLGKIGKHPNADRLSITQVRGAYPVVIQTEAFNSGDLAIHIPPDAIVDTRRPEFSFLADKTVVEGKHSHRVRFAKIRKVPSYGFLVPLGTDYAGLNEGDNVAELLGVTKYEPGPCYQMGGEIAGQHMSIPQEGVVPHYDIEGLRKYETLLAEGENVCITEKIHGSNGRWVYLDGKLHCGSRTKFRANSVWNRMAEKYNLEKILGENPGLVLYGEVYGKSVQDLNYGLDDQAVAFFDVYNTRTGTWYDVADFEFFCVNHDLPMVPLLYSGPFNLKAAYELCEGKTTLSGAHMREGIVIKPYEERWDPEIGRVFVKLVGEEYLLRRTV